MKTPSLVNTAHLAHKVKSEYGDEISADYIRLNIVPSVTPACQAALAAVATACGTAAVITAISSYFGLHPVIGAIAGNAPGAACIRAVQAASQVCP